MSVYALGTAPEQAVYRELTRRHIDFEFQPQVLGGPGDKGSIRSDFSIPSLNLIIAVQGEYWHSDTDRQVVDRMQLQTLSSMGWTVVWIDALHALKNARYYVGQALLGISHSTFIRR